MKVKGIFEIEHIRDGKVINKQKFENAVTYEGMNHILDVEFHGTAQITAWFLGLINNSGGPTLSIDDEFVGGGGHTGWVESTDYDEAARPAWNEDAAALGVIDSVSVTTFTIDTTVTIYGIFVTSNATKSNETGILWASGAFSSPIACVDDDTIKVNYSVTLSE